MSEGVFVGSMDQYSPGVGKKYKLLSFILAFGAIGGIIALINTFAAVPLVVDNSVPQPGNVRVFQDDQVLYVRWDDPSVWGSPPTYGFYITYKRRGAAGPENIRHTIHNTIQLQPLVNGQEYEITVQTARGTYQSTGLGFGADNTPATSQYWFRADGHVSPAVTVLGTPSSARVDAMRSRLTGFFDDFNEPTNPINELKWNSATTGRSENNTNGTFINTQFHAHTELRSGFGGLINRPRATFNTSVGINGGPLSESNPARVEWDMDITYDSRSNWYLDLIPLTVRRNKQILDINAHDQNDTDRGDEPANMLRFNVTPFAAELEYWDNTLALNKLPTITANTVCSGEDNTKVTLDTCDISRKTPGLSPLAELSDVPVGDQNVRRHFIMEITPTKARIFLDSALIMESTLPAAFASQREFTVHNAMFTYNTGKEWESDRFNRNTKRGIFPSTHFYHWDNFGFSGPAPTTVIHNYIEGGSGGTTPIYFRGEFDNDSGQRTTTIPIPDQIGSPVGGKAKLYFQLWGNSYYRWGSGDHILVNNVRYNVPNPLANMVTFPSEYNDTLTKGGSVHTVAVEINASDLRTGNNVIVNNMNTGQYGAASFTEPHIELEYAKSGPIPTYTPPIAIFGQAFSDIVEPDITNCDMYIYVEQDINLPYMPGKNNMTPAPCYYVANTPSHSGVGALLDLRDFEAEDAYQVTPQVLTSDDPNASEGKYITF